MTKPTNITVRAMSAEDVPLVVDYWQRADKDYLNGMGADIQKVPSRPAMTEMLTQQVQLPDTEKTSLAMILLVDGKPAGHCNVNGIIYGEEATMHLHVWNATKRQKGLGTAMVRKSVPPFFERLKLKVLFCEPYALNPGPNRTLPKAGFEFVKRYVTIPGFLNFEQEVMRYQLTRERFETLSLS